MRNGLGNLQGKICLIAGGTGGVGEILTQTFLEQGATVIVPSRTQEKLDGLRTFLGQRRDHGLDLLLGNLAEPAEASLLRDQVLARHGRLDAVVASLGGTWEEGIPLLQVPFETIRKYQDSNFNAHLITAQTFLPMLAERSGTSYTLLGGLSALFPVPLYSPVVINSAAQLMMTKILQSELRGSKVRINQVMYGVINTRSRAAHAKPEWVTAQEVASFVAYLASDAARGLSGGIMQFGDRPPLG